MRAWASGTGPWTDLPSVTGQRGTLEGTEPHCAQQAWNLGLRRGEKVLAVGYPEQIVEPEPVPDPHLCPSPRPPQV